MKQVKTAQDIKQLGTILSVWAHPDDESYLAAGIMATAVKNGQNVICITATRGEAGTQDESKWPAKQLAEIRTKELEAAMQELGIKQHFWLDYLDGCCCDISDKAASAQIRQYIKKYRPDSILTFGPDGLTGHKDHASVSRWVSLAAKATSPQPTVYHAVQTPTIYENYLKEADRVVNFYFNIDKPRLVDEKNCDICYCISPALAKLKHHTLADMPSQTTPLLRHFGFAFFKDAFGTECFVKA